MTIRSASRILEDLEADGLLIRLLDADPAERCSFCGSLADECTGR